jgi:NADPH2:quinone reductase
VIGNRGTIEINPRDAMGKDAAIIGMAVFNTPEVEMARIHAAVLAALENGTARPVVGERFPLAEAARAHEAVLAGNSHGKIVLIP